MLLSPSDLRILVHADGRRLKLTSAGREVALDARPANA